MSTATISFCNKGLLDLRALTTMGVSVKQSRSPIGFFGTGLKFGVATLLRTGHSVTIFLGGERHELTVRETAIRDEKFNLVCLDGQELGYTTMLGRNWEVWQAYRELASNARDEPDHLVTDEPVDPAAHDTVIQVTGRWIEGAHRDRDQIFCANRVIMDIPGIAEIREGGSEYLYYRGVRVHKLQKRSHWTWNITQSMELTEDRTLRHDWYLGSIMGGALAQLRDPEMIAQAVMATEDVFEHRASYSSVHMPSETFLAVVKELARNPGCSTSARHLWESHAPASLVYTDAEPDDEDRRILDVAEELCRVIDPNFELTYRVVRDLGPGVLGRVHGGEVLLAHSCLSMGEDMVAGTLYEEWLHAQHHLSDESRTMQNHLINQLVRMARRMPEENDSAG